MGEKLQQGQVAPDFTLTDQRGEPVTLSSFRGHCVLVYFYPKADTPGCTAQACGLRDIAGQIGTTAILGISPDPTRRLAAFDAKYGLGFPLLSDEAHTVAEEYGTWVERSMYGRKYMGIERSAFLVGPDQVLLGTWYKIAPAKTAPVLLACLGLA